jgi:SAM-dependent methyltransferase
MSKKRRPSPKPELDELMPLLISVWRRLHKIKGGPEDRLQTREFRGAAEGIALLNQRVERSDKEPLPDYFSDKQLLGSYLLYHWPLHYAQGLSLLDELPAPPRRVLDLCSGAAPFAFAAIRHGAEEVIALDSQPVALKFGAEICGKQGHTLTTRTWNALEETLPVDGSFDLITLGHSLHELFPETRPGWFEKQTAFIHSLLNRLTPDGFLLLVESSWPSANNRLLRLRNQLVEQEIPVQAPCVWQGRCPALQASGNHPCYAQRPFEKPYLVSELQRAAKINLGSLKMSYLLLRHPKAGWPELPKEPLYRVISPPVDSVRGKRYHLCGTDGKKVLGTRLSEHPAPSRAFEFLQRGDLLSIKDGLETTHLIEITPDTEISIRAACGKPLPVLKNTNE